MTGGNTKEGTLINSYTAGGVRIPSEELLAIYGVDDPDLVPLAAQVAQMRAGLPSSKTQQYSPSRYRGQVVSPGESGAPLD